MSASFAAGRKSSFRLRTRCQHAMPKTTTHAVVTPTRITCVYATIPSRFDMSAQTSVSSARPSAIVEPTGPLHPRVRDDDEERREPGAEREDPDRRQMHALREAVPAEDPETEERRLEHERGEPLDRERRAEHVSHELRVDRPVHPELELLHEPGRDADREVDQHERPEEAREAQPPLVAAAIPERLHDRDERREAEREGDEQEVVQRRRRELEAREIDGRDGQRHGSILRPDR